MIGSVCGQAIYGKIACKEKEGNIFLIEKSLLTLRYAILKPIDDVKVRLLL